jgi:hypothetical protein
MTDWTVAFDDGLTERLRRRTVCGRIPARWWDIWQGPGVLQAYLRCERCQTTDPEQHGLRAVMLQRYGSKGP